MDWSDVWSRIWALEPRPGFPVGALLVVSAVTLASVLPPLPQFLSCKMGATTLSTSLGCY